MRVKSAKKQLIASQQVTGDDYRMFKVQAQEMADVKSAMRWARRNSTSTLCVSEHSHSMAWKERTSLSSDKGRHRVFIGFTHDEDALAFQLSIENVEEIGCWPSQQLFTVYKVITDE